jgi:hypothetical protein
VIWFFNATIISVQLRAAFLSEKTFKIELAPINNKNVEIYKALCIHYISGEYMQ